MATSRRSTTSRSRHRPPRSNLPVARGGPNLGPPFSLPPNRKQAIASGSCPRPAHSGARRKSMVTADASAPERAPVRGHPLRFRFARPSLGDDRYPYLRTSIGSGRAASTRCSVLGTRCWVASGFSRTSVRLKADATTDKKGSHLLSVTAAHARLSMAIVRVKDCRGRPPTCRSGTHHTGHSLFDRETTTGTPRTSHPPTATSAVRTRFAQVATHSEYRS